MFKQTREEKEAIMNDSNNIPVFNYSYLYCLQELFSSLNAAMKMDEVITSNEVAMGVTLSSP